MKSESEHFLSSQEVLKINNFINNVTPETEIVKTLTKSGVEELDVKLFVVGNEELVKANPASTVR